MLNQRFLLKLSKSIKNCYTINRRFLRKIHSELPRTISKLNIITQMEQCNYVDPSRKELGIQYDDDLFSHTIFDNYLCIQSDDEKTAINTDALKNTQQLPIYCIFAHGKIITDVNVEIRDEPDDTISYHITTPSTAFFNLQREQYLYDTSPVGSLLMCSSKLNTYFNTIITHRQEFLDLLFSTNFKQVSTPIKHGTEFDLDSPLFSPPLFSTINKTLDFYDDSVKSPLRFGIVQLNKPIEDETLSILQTIGTQLTTETEEEKKTRCFNTIVSQPGILTNNPDAEIAFVQHLYSHNFRITNKELTELFGPGIYIMSTCSPLSLKINIDGIGKINYSSERGIISTTLRQKHQTKIANEITEKCVKGIINDLETIVNNLNYRWFEMVQTKEHLESSHNFEIDVKINPEFANKADLEMGPYENPEYELPTFRVGQQIIDPTHQQYQQYLDVYMQTKPHGGVKNKQTKSRKQKKHHKKRKTLKRRPRRSTRSRHRRS